MANGQSLISVIINGCLAGSFALSWGYMNAKTRSVIPSMIMHYLINATSEGFLASSASDARVLLHILGLILLYPIISIWVVKKLHTKRN